MNISLPKENESFIKHLSQNLELSESEIIDNIITYYRAYKRAQCLSNRGGEILFEFEKAGENDKQMTLTTGKELYLKLLQMFYEDMDKLNDFEKISPDIIKKYAMKHARSDFDIEKLAHEIEEDNQDSEPTS